MRYRHLGRSGLQVSAVGLGSWLTYGGSVEEDIAAACMRRAYDLGVTFFDTAAAEVDLDATLLARVDEVLAAVAHPR